MARRLHINQDVVAGLMFVAFAADIGAYGASVGHEYTKRAG